MGRSSRLKATLLAEPHTGDRVALLPGISREITHEEVGSPQHLERLRLYAVARYAEEGRGAGKITVRFENFCADCGHRLENHLVSVSSSPVSCRKEDDSGGICGCAAYYPGGGSRTDMKGNIVVQSDLPPGGEPWERQVCIFGLLRHEMCHELYTDREEHRRFDKSVQELDDPYSGQLYKCFNILEDGRIENIDKKINRHSYKYINGLNALHPRVAPLKEDPYALGREKTYTVPDGYTALDADGNTLDNIQKEIDPLTGETVSRLTVPAGTRISTWGPAPVSLPSQMRAALLATAVPGFHPGELHPLVQEALDECMPHVLAATRPPESEEEISRRHAASTKECIEHSRAVFEILKKHGLLFPPDEDEDPRGGGDSFSDDSSGDGDSHSEPSGGAAERSPEREDLEDLRKEIEKGMEEDRQKATEEAQKRRKEGDFLSEDIETGQRERVIPQSKLEEVASAEDTLQEERANLRSLGEDLASQLRLIRSQEDMLLGGQPRGQLDLRRLPQAVAGDTHVHTIRNIPNRPSVEVSIVIDRSASTQPDSKDQYRMAAMCGHAAEVADVPTGIYGYSGNSGVEHYTYKEPDSSSLDGLGAILKTGAGGTPTAEGIAFHAKKLTNRKAQKKIIVVVTDGSPDDLVRAAEEVEEARKKGLQVVGVGFRFSEGDKRENMDKIFGRENWENISEYSEVPAIVAGLVTRAVGAS